MADYDLAALSLGELTKIQGDVAKAISTHQDWQKAEARASDEALAQCPSSEFFGELGLFRNGGFGSVSIQV